MHLLVLLFGGVLLLAVLLDAFQTIILPRRPVGRFRLTRVFFLATWRPWLLVARLCRSRKAREQTYSIYGPLALLLLFVVWALMLTFAYGLLYFGLNVPFNDPSQPTGVWLRLLTCLYVSGTTLFTLGLGDVQPATHLARMFVVLEAGTGLGFVALVIGYVPVLYNAFSAREIAVAMLDARAGSPPTAGELLVRHHFEGGDHALTELLAEWERWCAAMLETHISYPILCYYRSQHDNQSWLSALTTVLDACALLITTIDPTASNRNGADHLSAAAINASIRQAQLTFAIGRHTLVDLGHVFSREKRERQLVEAPLARLDHLEFARLCRMIAAEGFQLCGDLGDRDRLTAIRRLYEPHAQALAEYLHLDLPLWSPPPPDPHRKRDQWATVASLRAAAALAERLSGHVSSQSTASHLQDDDAHGL
jgi:hypothetical protein